MTPSFPLRFLRLERLESREVPALVAALDPSFGTGGFNTTDFGNDDRPNAIAIQPDGKIVIAGSTGGATSDFAIARYNANGTLDTSFGGGTGKATIFFGAASTTDAEVATGVAVQADGKIVVVGYSHSAATLNDFAIARLNPNGSLDPSFDGDGKRTIDFGFGTDERASSVLVQPDGMILVGGSFSGGVNGSNFAFVRLKPSDGSFDNAFNGNGMQNVSFGGSDFCTSIALQPGGKIVAAGYTDLNAAGANANDFAILRLLGNGTLDNSFDSDGRKTIDFGFDDRAMGVAVQSDGKIVTVGFDDGGVADAAYARLSGVDGSLDNSFDGDGKVTYPAGAGASSKAMGVALEWNGTIDAVGFSNASGNNDARIQRLNADGSIFGVLTPATGGINTAGDDRGTAIAIDPNGRIVVAAAVGTTADFGVVRYVATVEEGRRLAVGGSENGQASLFTPNVVSGQYGGPGSTPAGLFPGYAGNVRVAVGDVDGDGIPDTVLITGPGTPIRFAAISGKDNATLLVPVMAPFAGSEDFTGGGFVAVADLDNDGRAEVIITPDQGGGPRVTIFGLPPNGAVGVKANFFGIDDPSFRGGARAAAGDVNGDGVQDIAVAAGFLGGPRIGVFNGKSLFGGSPTHLVNDFFAFPGSDALTLRNGSFVALGDINGDGFADLVFGGGPGGAPRVYVLSGRIVTSGNIDSAYASPIANFFVAGNSTDRGGVRVATVDADGDPFAELAVGSGEGTPSGARVYLGRNFTSAAEPGTVQDLSVFGGLSLAGGVFVG